MSARIGSGILLAIAISAMSVFFLAGCDNVWPSPYRTWKEEVKLNDGRTIVVEEKKLTQGLIARECWLSITLPEFGANPIVWHQRLSPLVVNVDRGKLYVVGFPPSVAEYREYGKPRSFYLAYVWNGNAWNEVSFEDIPESIYETNMYLEGRPPKGVTFVSLQDKVTQRAVTPYPKALKTLTRDTPNME